MKSKSSFDCKFFVWTPTWFHTQTEIQNLSLSFRCKSKLEVSSSNHNIDCALLRTTCSINAQDVSSAAAIHQGGLGRIPQLLSFFACCRDLLTAVGI